MKLAQNKTKKFYKGLSKTSINYKVYSTIIPLFKINSQLINRKIPELNFNGNKNTLAKKIHKRYHDQEKLNFNNANLELIDVKRALQQLESLRYLQIRTVNKDQQQIKIRFTKKGIQEYFKHKVNKYKTRKWDKKWRLVIFDILENKRQVRDLLRRKLKQFGFKELQKSVWIFPYDVKKEVKELLDVCNLDIVGDIRFLTVEKISNDQDLRKEFRL